MTSVPENERFLFYFFCKGLICTHFFFKYLSCLKVPVHVNLYFYIVTILLCIVNNKKQEYTINLCTECCCCVVNYLQLLYSSLSFSHSVVMYDHATYPKYYTYGNAGFYHQHMLWYYDVCVCVGSGRPRLDYKMLSIHLEQHKMLFHYRFWNMIYCSYFVRRWSV